MSDSTHPSPSISIFGLVFLQLLPTVVGFTVIFGWLTHQVLRYELSQYEEIQFEALRQQQDRIQKTQVVYEEEDFRSLLDDVCTSLDCNVNTIVFSNDSKELLSKEHLKMIVEIDVLNIPILLEVLRRHPQEWSLEGVEVHAYKQPSKIQVRLSRYAVPGNPLYPSWLSQLGWTELEQRRLKDVYGYWLAVKWQEKHKNSRIQNNKTWNRLFKTVNRDLWKIHLSKGSLVYTADEGMELVPLRVVE